MGKNNDKMKKNEGRYSMDEKIAFLKNRIFTAMNLDFSELKIFFPTHCGRA
jgi:hypothetical protein